MKEYWIIEPEQKIVSVFLLQDNNKYGRPGCIFRRRPNCSNYLPRSRNRFKTSFYGYLVNIRSQNSLAYRKSDFLYRYMVSTKCALC
ncbi:Uma2 family endonuclease [Desulfosporosinus nitroreducens]|uniref:Uma2 family endonuclease n=1 Tax=Desulfosporosinus nitroreducens TaxID=2018668 RepID=A0ABT8QJ03_9FIRM|nr:hypothetical protein [Desulfosporosinus nitroreducens]MDO0821286.1 Uma2 family endonuclease [Desulfosporosinus nitroreducens]